MELNIGNNIGNSYICEMEFVVLTVYYYWSYSFAFNEPFSILRRITVFVFFPRRRSLFVRIYLVFRVISFQWKLLHCINYSPQVVILPCKHTKDVFLNHICYLCYFRLYNLFSIIDGHFKGYLLGLVLTYNNHSR